MPRPLPTSWICPCSAVQLHATCQLAHVYRCGDEIVTCVTAWSCVSRLTLTLPVDRVTRTAVSTVAFLHAERSVQTRRTRWQHIHRSNTTDRDNVWDVASGGSKEAYVLDGVHNSATWRIWLNRPCAAAVRPFCQIFLTNYYCLTFQCAEELQKQQAACSWPKYRYRIRCYCAR